MQALLARIARLLDENNVPYMVIGGQAVLIHGEPRFTNDIDITLGLGLDQAGAIVRIAELAGWQVLVDEPELFVQETMVLPCSDPESRVRIEFIFSVTPYERQAIDRGVTRTIQDVPIRFATVEDLVIHKIFAGRARDLDDARTILLKNPGADRQEIRHWLEQFQDAFDQDYLARFDEIVNEVGG